MDTVVRVLPDPAALNQAAAEEIARAAGAAIGRHGFFSLALTGGETPRALYALLADKYRERIPWPRVHLFWGDERCVAADHPASNFAMAYQELVTKVPIPQEQVHRIPADLGSPVAGARQYEELLRGFFAPGGETFDVVLLGMGADGHTASLFPGSGALDEQARWVTAVTAPPGAPVAQRITLTLPALNGARDVYFLVAGAGKRPAVSAILAAPGRGSPIYPAGLVAPREHLIWFLDAAAGAAD